MISEVQACGFGIVRGLLDPSTAQNLIDLLGAVTGAGKRGMLANPLVRDLATSELLLDAVRPHLSDSPSSRPVRAIYFDKIPGSNWLVTWHQDVTISVDRQIEAPGFDPWSKKDGLLHVQPPVELLQNMITLRLHLDDTDASNGALRVLPGSHLYGKLTSPAIEHFRGAIAEETCLARQGDALLMRPLILHASGRSTSDRHRRVLHIEYAGADLPHGLQWNQAA